MGWRRGERKENIVRALTTQITYFISDNVAPANGGLPGVLILWVIGLLCDEYYCMDGWIWKSRSYLATER